MSSVNELIPFEELQFTISKIGELAQHLTGLLSVFAGSSISGALALSALTGVAIAVLGTAILYSLIQLSQVCKRTLGTV